MADWPKKHLKEASVVTVIAHGHAWTMDGPTFVDCLEAGGWRMVDEGDVDDE